MKMNANEYKEKLDTNTNLQLIVAGMAGLIDEGYTPHEVFQLLESTKENTFHPLSELKE